MIYVPADGVEPPQGHAGHGMGGLLIVNFNSLYCIAVNVTIANLVQYRDSLRVAVVADDVILAAVAVYKTEAHGIVVCFNYSMLHVFLCSQ